MARETKGAKIMRLTNELEEGLRDQAQAQVEAEKWLGIKAAAQLKIDAARNGIKAATSTMRKAKS